ncbi:MAG: YkvA family protein [Desulfosporosinus sp.]|nr:YkvA family protein [Desulfosporosinus sp.]
MYELYCLSSTTTSDRVLLGSALLYFILPTDVIPDYIFPIGYLDDAIAVKLVLDKLSLLKGHPEQKDDSS